MKEIFKVVMTTVGLPLTLAFLSGCSKHEFDPSDTMSSILSGEYGKGKFWNLDVILNGDTIKTEGYVRFDTKYQAEDGDFWFVNVIPGESHKEFKNIPLSPADNGVAFTIDYSRKTEDIHISGTVTLGEMTVNMTMSE